MTRWEHSRYDCSTLMKKERVSNGQWCKTFARTSNKSHDNPSRQLCAVCLSGSTPHSSSGVDDKSADIDRPSSILDDDGHPEEIPHSLAESSRGKKVRDFGDMSREIWTGWTFEVNRDLDDCNRRTRSKKVAKEHRQTHKNSDVVSIGFG